MDRQPRHTPPLRLAEVVAAFSLASDLGMGMPMEWAVRSTVIAVRLGELAGLDEPELRDVYYLTLLATIGCTADVDRFAAMVGDELAITAGEGQTVDWGDQMIAMRHMVRHIGDGQPPLRRARLLAGMVTAGRGTWLESPRAHCEVAQRLSERLGVAASVPPLLLQVFERWDGRGRPNGLRGEAIAGPMRVAHLARDIEPFHRLHGLDAAVAMARERSGRGHDPRLVDLFCRNPAPVCADLAVESAWETVLAIEPGPCPVVSDVQIDAAASAFADFVDFKRPLAMGHSRHVAALAAQAGHRCHLPESDVATLRRAGAVHDLGYAGVSAAILNKTGPLTEGDWERIRLHPYFTERVLARSPALATWGAVAALHHECPDGSGYHRGLPSAMLTPAARILAAANAYQSRVEDRPWRPALTPERAAEALEGAARRGALDPQAVNAVLAAAGHRVSPVRKDLVAGLSEREVEVLRLLARGFSNRETAGQLSISKETVNHHVRHIYDKTGVSTRAGAALFAVQHGLLDPGGSAR